MITNPLYPQRKRIDGSYGMLFDNTAGSGKNQYISVVNNAAMQGLTAMTFECWFYMNQTQISNARILEYRGNSNANLGIIIQSSGTQFACGCGNGTTNVTLFTNKLSQNTWYHLAFVWDGSLLYLFINGVRQATGTLVGGNTSNPLKNMMIGAFSPTSNTPFGGIIQEVRFSNNARYVFNFTPSLNQFVSDVNTILLLHMNEELQTSTFDSSSNNLSCSIGGNPLARHYPGLLASGNKRIVSGVRSRVTRSIT